MIAEARATLLTVKRMKEAGFTSVIFEGDSLVVAHAIQGIPEAQYWSIDCIINDILSLLPSFSFWLVSHVCRDFNTTAHAIARWAMLCNCLGTIPISSIPSDVLGEGREGSCYQFVVS